MSFTELFLIAIALSMDAFAVAICKGLSMPKMNWKNAVIVGLYFGGFQALMPFLGYLLGYQFHEAIEHIDHWIVFILLGIIGINMIREALSGEEEQCDISISPGHMILLALATSIDAMAVGVGFAFLRVNIILAVTVIGITTLVISIGGVKAGNTFGYRYKAKAEIAGGSILILMGLKVLVEHLVHLG